MNVLSFGVKIDGSSQAKQELREILDMQAKLNKGNVISGINPTAVLRSPEILAELKRLTASVTRGGPSHILQSDAFFRAGARSLLRQGSLIPAAAPFNYATFLASGLGIGRDQYRPARSSYQAMWQSLVPPQLTPPVIPQRVNWRQFGLGMLAAPFSPWIAARELNGSGLFGRTGGGLLGGGAIGFGKAFLVATVAAEGLRKAFDLLRDSIMDGAKLYQHAARLGLSTGKTFQLEAIGKALGLSPGEMDTLALRGSHPQRGERQSFFRQSDLKMLLGSGAGAGQLGGLQQVKNMGDYASRTFTDLAAATDSMSKNAKAMQEIFYQVNIVSMSLKALFTDIAALLLPVIKKIAQDIFTLIMYAELQMKPFLELGRKMGVIPSGDPGKNRLFASRGSVGGSASPWERMGFVIGGFGQQDYARKTADNTAEIAKNTKSMAEHVKSQAAKILGTNNLPSTYNFYHQLP